MTATWSSPCLADLRVPGHHLPGEPLHGGATEAHGPAHGVHPGGRSAHTAPGGPDALKLPLTRGQYWFY